MLIMELSKKRKCETKRKRKKEREEVAATASTDCRFAFLHTFMQIDDNIFFSDFVCDSMCLHNIYSKRLLR